MGCGASTQASTDAALIQWNDQRATAEQKQKAIATLERIARRVQGPQAVALFTTPGVVEAFVDAAQHGSNSQTKLHGVAGLTALAPVALTKLFGIPNVMATFMAAARNGETDKIKTEGLRGLDIYAMTTQNKSTVIDYPDYLNTLVEAVRNGGSSEVRAMALAGLIIPANSTTSKKMCEFPSLVETIVAAAKDQNQGIKSEAFNVIWNLTDHPQAADLFVTKTDLLEMLQANTSDTKNLPNIYLNLSVGPKSRPKLAQDEQVIKTLQGFSRMTQQKRACIVSKMALIILKGSDPRYLVVDPPFLIAIVEILAGAVTNIPVLNVGWPLIQPLLVLQGLTTIPENRRMLGVEWLKLLPVAVEVALTRNVVEPILCAESALSSIAQYMADARTLAGFTDNDKFLAAIKNLIEQRQHDAEWGSVVGSARNLMIVPEAQADLKATELPSQVRSVPPRLGQTEPLVPFAAYATPVVAAQIPGNAEDLKAWAVASGISEDVVEAMIKEGYVNAEMLRELANQSIPDLKAVLGLEQAAKASKLHKELEQLFAH